MLSKTCFLRSEADESSVGALWCPVCVLCLHCAMLVLACVRNTLDCKHTTLCSEHFKPDDFVKGTTSRSLKKGVPPTVSERSRERQMQP